MLRSRISTLLLFGLLLFTTGCDLTTQARSVEPSDFLGDVSQLREGGEDEALLIFQNKEIDTSGYRRAILDPVKLYVSDDSDLAGIDEDEAKSLVDYFDASLRFQVGGTIELVDDPAEDVIRIRVALTDASGASVLRNIASTVTPYGRAFSELRSLTVGTHSAVGSAQMEIEIVDSLTGARIGAAVDKRVGTKTIDGMFSKWSDTKDAMDVWSLRLANRILEGQQRQNAAAGNGS